MRELWVSRVFRISEELGECPHLHLVFLASSGRRVFYNVFTCILYWAVPLYLYVVECPWLCLYMRVTNGCTRIVHFLYLYHACDVLFLLLYTMRGRPFVVVSLRASYLASEPFSFQAFYLASGPYQPPGFFTPRYCRYYHACMYARVVLTSRTGTRIDSGFLPTPGLAIQWF